MGCSPWSGESLTCGSSSLYTDCSYPRCSGHTSVRKSPIYSPRASCPSLEHWVHLKHFSCGTGSTSAWGRYCCTVLFLASRLRSPASARWPRSATCVSAKAQSSLSMLVRGSNESNLLLLETRTLWHMPPTLFLVTRFNGGTFSLTPPAFIYRGWLFP